MLSTKIRGRAADGMLALLGSAKTLDIDHFEERQPAPPTGGVEQMGSRHVEHLR
jgi:hypothetical protein